MHAVNHNFAPQEPKPASPSQGGPKKEKRKYVLVVTLVLVAFLIGLQVGGQGLATNGAAKTFVESNRDFGPVGVDWNLLWNAIGQINEKFVDRPVDMQEILYGAVRGAVGSLGDPYSAFLPPQEATDFEDELKGNLEGIGAEIAIKNDRLTVVAPLDGTPAERAGIKAGDFIYKVNGEETANFSLQEAVSKIRGPAGTSVNLTVFHPGDTEATEIEIFRARIVVRSLEAEVREVRGRKLGYIKMRRFGDDSNGVLANAISNFLRNNIQGVVLDLRNNPGGFLETAVSISSNWVSEGDTVLIQRFGDGTEDVFKAKGLSRLQGIPTVVLINGGSASASEIVAGALRDHHHATLVGEKSFGKGSVQELVKLQDGADLKITIAKWLTPNGQDLNKEGLEPDVVVELTDEDFNEDLDPQLEKAYDLLAPF